MIESFDAWLERSQTEWREREVTTRELGTHSGRTRPWILPGAAWEEGLWPGIRAGAANGLPEYLGRHQIQRHTGANNLKSSWVLCANLYFPFRETAAGRTLLATFLQREIADDVQTVDAVELEFAETEELHPSELLGETGGRGEAGRPRRTSPLS